MPLIKVAAAGRAVAESFLYRIPDGANVAVGMRVRVPLQDRVVTGVVVEIESLEPPKSFNILPVEEILDAEPVVTAKQLELCEFVAKYYFCAFSVVVKLCLPAGKATTKVRQLPTLTPAPLPSRERESGDIVLTDEQAAAIEAIRSAPNDAAFLLEGVTGSGKTEVYLEIAKSVLAQGKSVLVIVPEIALTPQLERRFISALNQPIVMLHSGLTNAKRRDGFFALLRGQAKIAIGARSALFAPMLELGLIILDEEHDASLKQDEAPRYHGRDVALWRAKNEQAKIILGSATPSLESLVNVKRGKLQHLLLTKRIATASLPKIQIVDLKSRSQHAQGKSRDRALSLGQPICILSGPLKEKLAECLAQKKQAMILLNRRGYAAFALCDACGYIFVCKNCSVSMTFYSQGQILQCNQCDHTERLPLTCKSCNSGPILTLGLGTERVESEIRELFPEARIARLDRDRTRSHLQLKKTLEDMQNHDIDVLVGTQMLAKGHDFPGVSLVGVILADVAFALPDFRASERAFQLLYQVAGRAGRHDHHGEVIIQTFNPEHPAIHFVKNHNFHGFIKQESAIRREVHQPPFVRAALLRIEGKDPDKTNQAAIRVKEIISNGECNILGPAPAPIEKLRGLTRYQVYLRAKDSATRATTLQKAVKELERATKRLGCKLVIDIDPVQML